MTEDGELDYGIFNQATPFEVTIEDLTKKQEREQKKTDQARQARVRKNLKTRVVPLMPDVHTTKEVSTVSLDALKSSFVVDGLTKEEVAKKFGIPISTVVAIIDEGNLLELRGIMIRDGLLKLQNRQVRHAQELLDLEAGFQKLKIQSLKVTLQDRMTYLAYHGDFYLRNKKGEIVNDLEGIPQQIRIPNVAKDITDLKSALVLGEGLKKIMSQIQLVLEGQAASGEDLKIDDLFKAARPDDLK